MEENDFNELTKNKSPKYQTITIEKKNGGIRIISIPDDITLSIQKNILSKLHKLNLDFSDCSTAFQKGKSIRDNAKAHIGNAYMIRYDLRDFFDTIYIERVKTELSKRQVAPEFIKLISKWCFHHGHLPQGAATSPFLSNLVCANLDKRFFNLAEKIGANYTRYADDLIISGNKNILLYQSVFKRIIRTEHFFINHRKTRISVLDSEETRQDYPDAKFFVPYHIATGIAVDGDKISIPPNYLNQLWKELKIALKENITPQILGKISFVYFIDPKEGAKFYNYLIEKGFGTNNYKRIISYYFAQLKKNSKTKSLEGNDYFATPEPIGFKMVEWLSLKAGDRVLEPSAKRVTPSATFVNGNFEDFDISNKFEGIAMNPPFGLRGKTAFEHLAKAFEHLTDGGRLAAIVPATKTFEKRLTQWLESDDVKTNIGLITVIHLPNVTFKRAGTKMPTDILIIDKKSDVTKFKVNELDLRDIDYIDENVPF